jgi:hypothetical protein
VIDEVFDAGYNSFIGVDNNGFVHAVYECQNALWYATFPQGYTGK